MKERTLDQSRDRPFVFQLLPPGPASEMDFQPLHPDTGARLHDEPNLDLEFYRRTATDGMQSPCTSCCCGLEISQVVVTVAKKIENSVQPVIGSCFHSSAIKNVDHVESTRRIVP